jgi:hypothetical protein
MLKTHVEPMITTCCRTRTNLTTGTILRVIGARRRTVGSLHYAPERELDVLVLMPEEFGE